MMPIFAVQFFYEDKWKTAYISSYLPDAIETYEVTLEMTVDDAPIRLVKFVVDNYNFLGTECRDFSVLRNDGY